MSQVQTIRQLKKEGESVAGISRRVSVSRDTVYKYNLGKALLFE